MFRCYKIFFFLESSKLCLKLKILVLCSVLGDDELLCVPFVSCYQMSLLTVLLGVGVRVPVGVRVGFFGFWFFFITPLRFHSNKFASTSRVRI